MVIQGGQRTYRDCRRRRPDKHLVNQLVERGVPIAGVPDAGSGGRRPRMAASNARGNCPFTAIAAGDLEGLRGQRLVDLPDALIERRHLYLHFRSGGLATQALPQSCACRCSTAGSTVKAAGGCDGGFAQGNVKRSDACTADDAAFLYDVVGGAAPPPPLPRYLLPPPPIAGSRKVRAWTEPRWPSGRAQRPLLAPSPLSRIRNTGRRKPSAKHLLLVEALYHSALVLEPGERSKFLAEACSGDEELWRDVESLLMQAGSLLEHPVWELLEPETWRPG